MCKLRPPEPGTPRAHRRKDPVTDPSPIAARVAIGIIVTTALIVGLWHMITNYWQYVLAIAGGLVALRFLVWLYDRAVDRADQARKSDRVRQDTRLDFSVGDEPDGWN